MRFLIWFVTCIMWVAGVVLANSWWKLLAICFPFYGWYLVVEKIMIVYGVI